MKKLNKVKKIVLAVGVAVVIIVVMWGIILSNSGNRGKVNKNVASDGTSKTEEKLSVGKAIYDENDETIHDSILVYEIIKKSKTPKMKVSSYYEINLEKMEIPSKVEYEGKEYTVTSIGESAFESNTAMEEVIIPDTVKKIGDSAFYSNAVLAKVTLSDSVEEIGDSAFAECMKLKEVNFGKGIKRLGNEVFSDCIGIKSMSIPGTIESMGKSVFFGCENMEDFTFGDGMTLVGDETFTNCYKLENVKLPDSIVSIGKEAFWSCEKLKSLTIPSKVALVGESAFYSAGIEKLIIKSSSLQPSLDMVDGCDAIKTIEVPKTLVSTYKDCFADEEFKIEAIK